MSKEAAKSKFSENYVYSMLYRLSVCVLPILVTPYLARVLGAEGNGIYILTSTVASFFIMFSKMGLDNYGNRSVAYVRNDTEARSRAFLGIYAVQLLTSLLSLAAYALMILLFIKENQAVYWIQVLFVASALFDVSWFFYGTQQFKLTTIRSLIARALIVAGIFIFVKDEGDLLPYTYVMSVCYLLEQVLLFFFIFKSVHLVRLRKGDITKHLLPNLKLFIPILSLSVYHWMDKIMLGTMVDMSSVSYYNYAESIINLPKGIVQALGTVLMPQIAFMVTQKRFGECKRLFTSSVELVCFICCALCFGIMGVAEVFVPLFLGPDYTPTILLTMELAVVMVPMTISDAIQTQYLIPLGRDRIYIFSTIYGAIANVVLNAVLIPFFGASGAVIGTFGAELVVCGYQMLRIRREYAFGTLLRTLAPFFLFGMAEAFTAWLLGKLPWNVYLVLLTQVAVAGCLYLLLSFGYFAWMRRRHPDYTTPLERLQKGATDQRQMDEGGEAM